MMKNLRFQGSIALLRIGFSGMKEDPIHFSLLVSRRMASSGSFLRSTEFIARLLKSPQISRFRFSKRILSSILLLEGRPNESLELLSNQNDQRSMCARARIYAFLGEYEMAFSEVTNAGGTGKRLAKHYAAEMDVLSKPLNIARNAQRSIDSMNRSVLHLLTNSLPYTNSGYTQRSHSVLKSIQNAGWEVFPFSRIGYPWNIGILPNDNTNSIDGITYRRLLPSVHPATVTERLAIQSKLLANAVEKFNPAVLHTTTEFLNGVSVKDVAETSGIPWIYEVRGQLADTWLSGCEDRRRESYRYVNFKAREAEVAMAADAVITLGTTMRDELVSAGVDPERILICPNAVGQEFIEDIPNKSDSRKEIGLEEDWQLIGTVSSLVGYEGLDLLVRAFADLVPSYPKLRLVIVGDGTERERLIALAEELGVKELSVFPGRVEKFKARLYHRAMDVFIVPRRDLDVTRAVTPLKPVEAMAFEVPVVATDLPALREIVDDGIDGLLFEAGNQSQLAEKIRVLLSDDEMRSAMGKAGRRKVLSSRTWAANAEKITRLYSSLCDVGR